VDLYSAFL